MNQNNKRRPSWRVKGRSFIIAAASLFAGACAIEQGDAGESGETRTREQELIGGQPVSSSYFRSTVGIGGACTAAKVGPRLFLTAAHCVDVERPFRGQPVPDDFPPNGGVHADYLPGRPLLIDWGLSADVADSANFTIVRTTIHPSWWACPLCQDPSLQAAADIAIVEIAENTPQIPAARVDLRPLGTGVQVVKVGWGCEERTNIDISTLALGRYKADDASTIAASSIQHESFSPPIADAQAAQIGASYLITAGHAQNDEFASLCLGDSGGPLYLPNSSDPRVVGVNSNYTFKPSDDPEDLGGISWTDWHTKTSSDSLHGVGAWLVSLGVTTVGGTPTSNCTCAKGCNAIKRVSAPLMKQGIDDSCYFFQNLGYSLNNHSMVQVTLNGQNITNRWMGHWDYPTKRDGGYYVYIKGQLSWSWWQATN